MSYSENIDSKQMVLTTAVLIEPAMSVPSYSMTMCAAPALGIKIQIMVHAPFRELAHAHCESRQLVVCDYQTMGPTPDPAHQLLPLCHKKGCEVRTSKSDHRQTP